MPRDLYSTSTLSTAKAHIMRLGLLLAFALSPLVAADEIQKVYKYVDEQGNVTYSDSPPLEEPDLEPAKLPSVFIQPSIEVRDIPPPQPTPGRISVDISSPENGAIILASQKSFRVSGNSNRRLQPEESARLRINGEEHSSGNSLNWTLSDLVRGEYSLSIEILNKNDKVISVSEPVSVYVQRPSVGR